jgi:hypothetical protein
VAVDLNVISIAWGLVRREAKNLWKFLRNSEVEPKTPKNRQKAVGMAEGSTASPSGAG